MRVKIRLYRPHDMDLIALKRSDTYKLGVEMKKCLIAYATGEIYEPPAFSFSDNRDGYVGKTYQMHLDLNPKKPEEKETIDMLLEIRAGYRCAFIKTLFRSNCPYLPLLVFSDENGLTTSRWDAFQAKQVKMHVKEHENAENLIAAEHAKEQSVQKTKDEKEEPSKPPQNNDDSSVDTNEFDTLFEGFNALG